MLTRNLLWIMLMASWAWAGLAYPSDPNSPGGKSSCPADPNAHAGEQPAAPPAAPAKLAFTLDTTFVTKYLWRGYDVLDDHAAVQPSVNADFFGTGLSANVWGSFAFSSGFEDLDELDYTVAYARTLCEDQPYALRLGANYIYYDYPNTTSLLADAEEVGASAALTKLIPPLGPVTLAPSYYVGCLWPARSGAGNPDGGWFHTLALGCATDLPRMIPGKMTQSFCFGWDITYNDGAFDADHDWSHTSWYAYVALPVGPVTITPSLRYQISMDKSVNDEDELWGGLSLSLSF